MSSFENIYIYVDDIRDYTNWDKDLSCNREVIAAKTYKEAIQALETCIEHKSKIIIDLDHDLGCKKTGYDIAKWIVTSGYRDIKFKVHSMNVVGAQNIREVLSHYDYKEIK